ncbi:Uu.00g138330.m01.CDS01 [Anthostomella pinea]|uniref:Uu.00g138330.m01.CDS01 n=1 Tax=Anthostomella pinea TaxID=933095 RepID=A0AAI8YL58_9PEZI|nr:Uu.00g138330.m01.CDS01 [Anthostomella pinea]
MTDLLGAIDASVSLAERLYNLTLRYMGANDSAEKLHLFSGQVNTARLKLPSRTLESNERGFRKLQRGTRFEIETAATALEKDLGNAVAYLGDHDPSRSSFHRLSWVLWVESSATKLFDDIHRHMDVLQGIVELVRLAPKARCLNDAEHPNDFKIYFPPMQFVDHDFSYCVSSHWGSSGNAPREAQRGPLLLFVESYRPDIRKTDDQSTQDSKRLKANQVAERIATMLWWSCDSDESYQTGLLPSIGSDQYRVCFLIPKNAKDQKTLGNLIRESQPGETHERKVPLEMRLSLALQLAEAIRKVHSAGLAHCAIRSDTVLFLAPLESQENDNGELGIGRQDNERYNMDEPKPLKRTGTMGAVKRTLTRALTFTAKADKSSKGDPSTKRVHGAVERRTSQRSVRDKGKGGRRERVARVLGMHDDTSSGTFSDLNAGDNWLDDTRIGDSEQRTRNTTTDPKVGSVPPGFGSVYLTYWGAAHQRGVVLPDRNPHWPKDIYRHPEQQRKIEKQVNMGHDTYSLGVCLLEIGLWELLVNLQQGHTVPSRLASKACTPYDPKKTYDRETTKQGLVRLAEEELPGAMGDGYVTMVKACLTCLDDDAQARSQWGVRFKRLDRKKDCNAFRDVVVSFLSKVNTAFQK